MKRDLTSQQEAFAQAVASGKSQSDAYRSAYPKSLKWKPDTLWNRASALMRNSEVLARTNAIRAEVAEKGLWTREDSVNALISVIQEHEKKTDIVAAVKELNAMHGFEAPKKIEHSGNVVIAASPLDENI